MNETMVWSKMLQITHIYIYIYIYMGQKRYFAGPGPKYEILYFEKSNSRILYPIFMTMVR